MKIYAFYRKIQFILISFLIGSCNGNDKYSDFKTDTSGLKYKFLEESESKEIIAPGDYVEMELKYANELDSLLFNSKELRAPFRMQIKDISHKGGSFENAVFLSHPGCRILFVLPADSFYYNTIGQTLPKGVKKGTDLMFELKIIRKLSKDEIIKERELFLRQMNVQEESLIKSYIAENELNVDSTPSGLYIVKKKAGSGPIARIGKILTVNYTGKFTDGIVFDSSYKRKITFRFELGAKQVIDAWEEACSKMRVGDLIILITPSKLAYGKDGYGEIIPAFCPLVFEIELVGVN